MGSPVAYQRSINSFIMSPIILSVPRIVLTIEYFIGGWPRISSWPFKSLHERIYRKSQITAPHLHPVYPFTDPRTTKLHMQYIGVLMVMEGFLLAFPWTRASVVTLFLGCFLTSSGYWSQMRSGMPYWLPVTNFLLAWVVWGLENGNATQH
ncbi:unnamed protein product [Colletotrichum noveboracense]|uniref:Uncharacterized protein n=1 Tax=Colletotrichum noveboracense TaxID=2664923 RepID=A0A9W4W4V1_9PEZI|nr:unnamed protein product [Colletotrichum noveboracense]